MHGWTSQPWRPTVVLMVEGTRRDMNIPAQAGIQFMVNTLAICFMTLMREHSPVPMVSG
jgi:hypothetical protein